MFSVRASAALSVTKCLLICEEPATLNLMEQGTLRSHLILVVYLVFWGFVLALLVGGAVNPHDPLAGRVACGLLAIPVSIALVLFCRAGIMFNSAGITVRRYSGRTSRVSWGEVASFTPVSNGNSGVYVAAVLKSGRRLKTQGLAGSSSTSRKVVAAIATLESARARFDSATPTPGRIASSG